MVRSERLRQRESVYGRREQLADGVIHLLGIAASVAAAVTLATLAAVYCLPALSTMSLGIYGAALAGVFCCSAAYHLAREGKAKALLRRIDHAAIYVKIAATYCIALGTNA
jgi:hemolysin III